MPQDGCDRKLQPSVRKAIETGLTLTPTQTIPLRAKYSADMSQAGALSKPAVEFSHSTTTVPLKRQGKTGRRTTMRVV